MTISTNMGDAKRQLSSLVAAAGSGELVMPSEAGAPLVRLVPVAETVGQAAAARAARRRAAFGMYKHLVCDFEIDVRQLRAEDADLTRRVGFLAELPLQPVLDMLENDELLTPDGTIRACPVRTLW